MDITAQTLMKQIDEQLAYAQQKPGTSCFGTYSVQKRTCMQCNQAKVCRDKKLEIMAEAQEELEMAAEEPVVPITEELEGQVQAELDGEMTANGVVAEPAEQAAESQIEGDLGAQSQVVDAFAKSRRQFIGAVIMAAIASKPETKGELSALYIETHKGRYREEPTAGAVKYDVDKICRLLPEVTAKRGRLEWA